MTRFYLLDLSLIPPPDAVRVLDFDVSHAAWLAAAQAEAARYGYAYNVASLRSDPAGWAMRVGAYRGDIYKSQEVNDGVKAVLLATATGADLDNVCADLAIARQTLVPADLTVTPPVPAIMESDDSLRRRRALAPEALSVAGPNAAYLFYALDAHPDVRDCAVYGPEHGVGVPDGCVWMVLLSKSGQGGQASPQVCLAVAKHLAAWDAPDVAAYIRPTPSELDANTLRPNTARITVQAATIHPYTVSGTLIVPPGADADVLRLTTQNRIAAYAAARNKVGAKHTRDSLIAAGRMLNADGTSAAISFQLVQPVADMDPGPLGAAWLATIISLNVVVADG